MRDYGGAFGLNHYVIGVHFGAPGQFNALAVIEQHVRRVGPYRTEVDRLSLRHFERLAPGTAYRSIADTVEKLAAAVAKQEGDELPDTVVGIAEVGRSALQFFDEGVMRLISVTVTQADAETEVAPNQWRLARREMIGNLAVALERGKLGVATGLDLSDVFKRQLETFRRRPASASSNDIGPTEQGDAEDLVLAAALAVWRAGEYVPMIGPMSYEPPVYVD